MDATHEPAPERDPHGGAWRPGERAGSRPERVDVTVRRSPKYGVFMGLGALLGAIGGWLFAASMPQALNEAGERVDTTPVIGLMLVVGFVAGGALGALVAIVLDRALAKRTTAMTAEHVEHVEADARGRVADGGVEGRFDRLEEPGRSAADEGDRPGAA
ncbi:hypothetical protein [Agrococcus sp. HG114]|uniref:hypothetical protein n=1 Tax=Agrococcus sp. HG114 TaxID=2969757 RepID=UPI00215A8D80|nr:hypothetical protein [Agrococcus sp. HG114]MCR8671722.1 hypothetical protein [Agrococcus sp. HG114]